jgi:ATP-dependent exoDNAse (exonuclease V) beta subunit
LPEGEVDLLGPGLKAALDKLCAQPDPAAGSDFGVQLMTIHKSKGLEFEVVLVPDLEAESRKGERAMISWLERGLADPGFTDSGPSDPNGQLTEFLIAPIQAKGADASAAKTWVDSVKRERERQELRRLLYVAATRAREELHLFARPRYRISTSGEASLCNPTGLLATAWPAFGGAIESRFEAWLRETTAPVAGAALTLAAQSENPAHSANLLQMPAAAPTARPTRLRRLPENYTAPDFRRRCNPHPSNPEPSAGRRHPDQRCKFHPLRQDRRWPAIQGSRYSHSHAAGAVEPPTPLHDSCGSRSGTRRFSPRHRSRHPHPWTAARRGRAPGQGSPHSSPAFFPPSHRRLDPLSAPGVPRRSTLDGIRDARFPTRAAIQSPS